MAVLPVLVFSGILLFLLNREQIRHNELSLLSTTRALTAAVDERIASAITGLRFFASAEDFDRKNLNSLQQRVERGIEDQPGWFSVALVSPTGEQFFNTARPRAQELPSFRGEKFFEEVLRTRQPSISDYRIGLTSGASLISVAIPVMREERLQYVLIGSFEVRTFTDLLLAQKIPESWTAAILGRDTTIIARSRSPELFVGKPATRHLAERSRLENEAVFEDVTQEGHAAYGAFTRSNLTGWTVVLGLPAESAWGTSQRLFWTALCGGLILMLVSLGFAVRLGRHIAYPMTVLTRMASALGQGKRSPAPELAVTEATEVARALEKAAIERDRSEQKLHEAIQVRDNFLSIASHELKTPLTSLRLQLQLLARKTAGTSAQVVIESATSPMIKQVQRLARLIDDLLDVARISSGKMEFNLEEFNLVDLVKEIVFSYQSESDRVGSMIAIDAPAPVVGRWDYSRVEQIVVNLLSNALKYGAGRPVEITIHACDGRATLAVQDQGIGIRPEDQARIFQRFERAVSSRNFGGLGLGLWITQRIVEGLHGRIRVESAPNVGSRFVVELTQHGPVTFNDSCPDPTRKANSSESDVQTAPEA